MEIARVVIFSVFMRLLLSSPRVTPAGSRIVYGYFYDSDAEIVKTADPFDHPRKENIY